MDVLDRVLGCLLGGAIGDALGAPIEFDSLRDIRRAHGAAGIGGYVEGLRGTTGLITDDTQMTLFTVEGLLTARASTSAAHGNEAATKAPADARGVRTDTGPVDGRPVDENPVDVGRVNSDTVEAVRQAYLRWLDTQDYRTPPPASLPHHTGSLREEGWLYSRRAPGNACLSGLHRPFPGPAPWGEPGPVNRDSKGCGTVMRSAPFGLIAPPEGGERAVREAFELSAACAQITHGHPTGYLAAGAFAAIIAHLMAGEALEPAVRRTLGLLAGYPKHEETSAALQAALDLAATGTPGPEAVESLGGAWVAEEALAIGVYCALAEPDVERALLLSVNHSGDSDSTGSVCGNIVGALRGREALPAAWLRPLEGRETIERLAAELARPQG
ncbi:ADP-ribosylglycohydrolase family protein [Nonomuraea sp. NPDC052634]|uniref:ADP-ribosylglycohydrolase family protein n=1 Tax=Nonomuraea sp. NPDC052634 TaxID=3155813 RepID=UPI00343171B1